MNLHREFVRLSFDIIKMKNKLISLLLEIYEKEIYKQHGCRTIKEYGFKYAKLSGDVVEKALRTLKHVEDKPCLKKMIETQGMHKVALVATIATPETDGLFAQHVENMSKPALFEFAKEIRNGQQGEVQNLFGEKHSESEVKNKAIVRKCHAVPGRITIELDEESQILFLRLKNKYAKDCSNKEALKILFQKFEEKDVPGNGIEKRKKMLDAKQKIDKISGEKFTNKSESQNISQIMQMPEESVMTSKEENKSEIKFPTRYIPAKQKREILEKYHHKCAYPNCVNPAEQLHHRTAFGFEQSHESVVPLCEVHHQFAHNGIIKYELREPENWQLNIASKKTVYDNLYLKYRNQQ